VQVIAVPLEYRVRPLHDLKEQVTGRTTARADLALAGHAVRLWNRSPVALAPLAGDSTIALTAEGRQGKARLALVTGGGRGIGRAIALAFAGAGCAVAVAARSREQIEAVAAEIRDIGVGALAVRGPYGAGARAGAAPGRGHRRLR